MASTFVQDIYHFIGRITLNIRTTITRLITVRFKWRLKQKTDCGGSCRRYKNTILTAIIVFGMIIDDDFPGLPPAGKHERVWMYEANWTRSQFPLLQRFDANENRMFNKLDSRLMIYCGIISHQLHLGVPIKNFISPHYLLLVNNMQNFCLLRAIIKKNKRLDYIQWNKSNKNRFSVEINLLIANGCYLLCLLHVKQYWNSFWNEAKGVTIKLPRF